MQANGTCVWMLRGALRTQVNEFRGMYSSLTHSFDPASFILSSCLLSRSVHTDLHCPHNKTVMYPTGFLPCAFIKIRCCRGTPCSIYK
jgi:hypothetical protein